MGALDITFPFFLSQALNFLVTLAWLLFIAFALRSLRRRYLSDEAKALWAAIVILIPFLGAIALWVVTPPTYGQQTTLVLHHSASIPTYREPRPTSGGRHGVELGQVMHERSPI